MSASKRGLGRGFDSLIPDQLMDESFDPTSGQDDQVSDLRTVKLSEITADPEQPRRHFEQSALDELADSIRVHGVLQPIVLTSRGGKYVIVAGERRYRASKLAGLEKIPAIVRTLSDQHKLELSLIENLQRRDLNVMETATAYAKLRDQFNMTLEQIGHQVGGKSVSAVSNTLRLLKLPHMVQKALVEGKITEGQARPLVGHDNDLVKDILPKIIDENWSARKIEQFIVQLKQTPKSPAKATKASTSIPYGEDTKRLESHLKAPIAVKTNARGAGQIVIRFKDAEDFERIKNLLDK